MCALRRTFVVFRSRPRFDAAVCVPPVKSLYQPVSAFTHQTSMECRCSHSRGNRYLRVVLGQRRKAQISHTAEDVRLDPLWTFPILTIVTQYTGFILGRFAERTPNMFATWPATLFRSPSYCNFISLTHSRDKYRSPEHLQSLPKASLQRRYLGVDYSWVPRRVDVQSPAAGLQVSHVKLMQANV